MRSPPRAASTTTAMIAALRGAVPRRAGRAVRRQPAGLDRAGENVRPTRCGTSRRRCPASPSVRSAGRAGRRSGGRPNSPTPPTARSIDDGQTLPTASISASTDKLELLGVVSEQNSTSADQAQVRDADRGAAVPDDRRAPAGPRSRRERHRAGLRLRRPRELRFTVDNARQHQGAGGELRHAAAAHRTTTQTYGFAHHHAHHLPAPGRVLRRGGARAQPGQRDVERLHQASEYRRLATP